HFPWQPPADAAPAPPLTATASASGGSAANNKAVGHKRALPAQPVVTTASSNLRPAPSAVKSSTAARAAQPRVDFAFLRQQVRLEDVLRHLGFLDALRGRGPQRR